MGRVTEKKVGLPYPVLEGADWADAWQTMPERPFASAREAGEAIVQAFPKITYPLLIIRQIIVLPFGLKGSEAGRNREKVGIFPLVSEAPERIVAGFDDRHLDFRIVVDLGMGADSQTLALTTVIKRHNALGRAYLQMVLPFHRWIIRSALSKI